MKKIRNTAIILLSFIIIGIHTLSFADVGSFDRYDSGSSSSDWGSSSSDWGSSSSSWDWDDDYSSSSSSGSFGVGFGTVVLIIIVAKFFIRKWIFINM